MTRRQRSPATVPRIIRFVFFAAAAVVAGAVSPGCGVPESPRLKGMPDRMLWAWERPEDLRFAEPGRYGVAFLAQTLLLENDEVKVRSRRQPLEVAKGAYVVAVTRVETSKDRSSRPGLGDEQIRKAVDLIERTTKLPGVRAVQVDFDAVVSERPFYRRLLASLREALPEEVPVSITSLASWCMGDRWFSGLPVDEVVPMAFDMGKDDKTIRNFLKAGNDWKEPLCRRSYGLMLADELYGSVDRDRRIYYFKESSWQPSDLSKIEP